MCEDLNCRLSAYHWNEERAHSRSGKGSDDRMVSGILLIRKVQQIFLRINDNDVRHF